MSGKVGKNLLLVEKDLSSANQLKNQLKSFGFRVYGIDSVAKALEFPYQKNNINLLLIDSDGENDLSIFKTAKNLYKQNRIPFGFILPDCSPELIEQCDRTGGFYIPKQISRHVLKSTIEMAIKLNKEKEKNRAHKEKLRSREGILNEKNKQMTFLRDFALEIASGSFDDDLYDFLVKKLKQITNASLVLFSEYHQEKKTLKTKKIITDKAVLNKVLAVSSKSILETESPVSEEMYHEITNDIIGSRKTLTEVSFGEIPPAVDILYRKLSGVNRFVGIAYILNNELYGTSLLGIHRDEADPPPELLKSFAHIAAVALRKQKAETQLLRSEQKYKELVNNINDVIFTIDKTGKVLFISDEILTITGYYPRELLDKNFSTFIYKEDLPGLLERFKLTMSGHLRPHDFRVVIKSGQVKWIRTSSKPVILENGERGLTGILADISERKKSEQKIKKLLTEKEIILKEVHHRIKNNMNIIATMLSVQARDFTDHRVRNALEDIAFRVQSMIVLYDKLYRSDNFLNIALQDYIQTLINEIKAVYLKHQSVEINTEIDAITIPVKHMTYLGIIINELINNSLRHGFKNRQSGKIDISANKKGDRLVVCHRDNGVGYQDDREKSQKSGFGLKLIKLLVKQFRGEVNISNADGTEVRFDLLLKN